MADVEAFREREDQPTIASEEHSLPQSGLLVEKRMVLHLTMIAIGAALGANLRYGVSIWVASRFGTAFPYGTLMINVVGSFLIGLLMALSMTRLPLSESLRLFVVTGLLGGFTTFSSFSYEAYMLVLNRSWLLALLYLIGSMLLGFLSVVLAFGLVKMIG